MNDTARIELKMQVAKGKEAQSGYGTVVSAKAIQKIHITKIQYAEYKSSRPQF